MKHTTFGLRQTLFKEATTHSQNLEKNFEVKEVEHLSISDETQKCAHILHVHISFDHTLILRNFGTSIKTDVALLVSNYYFGSF